MNKLRKFFHYLVHDRDKIKSTLLVRTAKFYKSDENYLKKLFRLKMGKELNLENPKTFSEKLQWLKLHDRKPEYTQMVDKAEVKKYVANLIGEEYIIPTLGVYDSVDEINFDALPNQFVLKCTHDSGGLVICKDKSKLDIKLAKKRLAKNLKRDYYYQKREWPYKNVKPRIIAEQYITDSSGVLNDYKFFCFNGEPKVILVATDRDSTTGVCFDYFDIDFKHLPFEQGGPNSKKQILRPKSMEKMVDIAAKLSFDIPHVRIDLYDVDGKIYFGEITFFDSSGMAEFNPKEWDFIMGSWINLNDK